jgi:hypothetical protein
MENKRKQQEIAGKKTHTNLKTMHQELQQALDLINKKNLAIKGSALIDPKGLNNTQSLLERCAKAIEQGDREKKPTLRIIHHFACSGGTLISKCLAAQPNVFLLSELHPTTRNGNDWSKAAYTPRDVVTQTMYARVPQVNQLAEDLFIYNICQTEQHIRYHGGHLVIRAHSHADFCMHDDFQQIDTVTRVLSPFFDIEQLVTVRNPIDSFISLRQNGWVNFSPKNFDEYCRRLLLFLNGFHPARIHKYEDFVKAPAKELKKMAQLLKLKYIEDTIYYMDTFKVSGDSGRSSSKIFPRPRKEIDDNYSAEIKSSENFKIFCEKYGYSDLA